MAGKTATVTVNLNARTGISITGPTTAVVRRHAGHVHRRGRRRTRGEHSRCHGRLRRRYTKLARSDQRVDAGPAHLYWRMARTGRRRRQPKRAASPRLSRRSLRYCRSSRRASSSRRRTRIRSPGETVIFTATVSGATSTILRYEWNFGRAPFPPTATTTGNRATATYDSARHERHHCESRPGVRAPRRGHDVDSSGCGYAGAVVARLVKGSLGSEGSRLQARSSSKWSEVLLEPTA